MVYPIYAFQAVQVVHTLSLLLSTHLYI